MKLLSSETELIGKWVERGGQVCRDEVCERIELLITNHLKEIAMSEQWGAWETLFQDPDDGRYWERTYPQGELQGGGPPQLRYLPFGEACEKYGIDLSNSPR